MREGRIRCFNVAQVSRCHISLGGNGAMGEIVVRGASDMPGQGESVATIATGNDSLKSSYRLGACAHELSTSPHLSLTSEQ